MNADRWRQIDEFFHAAAECAADERAAFLDEACAGDDSLRREVESLLAADSAAEEMATAKLPAKVAADLLNQPSARVAAGQLLNQYKILSPLGAGGMGEVFLAEDTRLHRKVALKLLPAQFASDPDRIRRFEQEAHAVSALNHPNIITLFDLGRAGEDYFLATEFIDGQTLRQRLRDGGRLPVSETLDITLQICQALAAAHEAGIIHRDIKPENVMLRRDGYVKVLDFGLAKVGEHQPVSNDSSQSSLTDPGTVMGTASYMSPEQARGQRVDVRTDIFSLGIVLYEMIAGRTPFEGANMFEVVGAILGREPAPLRNLNPEAPDELQRIVSQMLRKTPDQRYPSIREALGELDNLRDELKLAAKLNARQSSDAAMQTGGAHEEPKEVVKDASSNSSAKIILGEIKRHKRGVFAVVAISAALLAGGAFGLFKLLRGNPAAQNNSAAAVKVTPLTAFAGLESKPSFAPDGNQIAFSWVGENGDNTDIYIKEIGGEGMRRLTTHPGIDSDAVWSPDGRSIAFFRITEEGGAIYVMPSLGGVERKLTDISPLRATQILQADMSWSPDGKLLAVADRSSLDEPMGIVLVSVASGERRKLTTPIPNTTGDYTPSFSPDGKTILFNRSAASESERDGYVVSVSGGEPQKITNLRAFLTSIDWLPDGKGIVYAIYGGNEEGVGLWKMTFPNGTPERLTGRERNVVGHVTDRHRNRLLYISGTYDIDIWRTGLQAGKAGPQAPARFIHSTKVENLVSYSQDGKTIAFASMRSGQNSIWFCDADGQNSRQILVEDNRIFNPTWSPDGRKVAFNLRLGDKSSIYVMNSEGGQKVRLSDGMANDGYPVWSHDGQWIYFRSDRTGQWH